MNQIKVDIKSIFFLLILAFFVSGCAKNTINFKLSKEYSRLEFKDGTDVILSQDAVYKNWMSACVMDSYTILDENSSFGKLFIESVTLDSHCKWRSLALSSFESNLKREFRENYMKTVESIEVANISFRTFKIDDAYISLINIYDVNSEKFILDYSGKLYTKLISSYKTNYVDKFSNQKRYTKTYNDSLVRKNFVYRYFYREIERVDKP